MNDRGKAVASSARRSPAWHWKLLFNVLLLTVVGVVGYTIAVHVSAVSVPAIVTGTEIELAANASGTMVALHTARNVEVRKGQVLAELRNDALDAEISAASAEVDELIRSREQARSDVSRALRRFAIREKVAEIEAQIATLDVEIASASRAVRDADVTCRRLQEALDRAAELVRAGALTRSELDARWLTFNEAEGTRDDLQSQLLRLQTQREGLIRNIALYEQQLQNLEQEAEAFLTDLDVAISKRRGELETLLARREQMTLRAEADGIVSDVLKQEGEHVAEGETILAISTGGELWVEAYLEPDKRNVLETGERVEIVVDAAGRNRLPGQIQGTLPTLKPFPLGDSSGLTTPGTYVVVLIAFAEPQQAAGLVRPGQRVQAVFVPSRSWVGR